MENLLGHTFWYALLTGAAISTLYLWSVWVIEMYKGAKEWITETIYWYYRNKQIKSERDAAEKRDFETREFIKRNY